MQAAKQAGPPISKLPSMTKKSVVGGNKEQCKVGMGSVGGVGVQSLFKPITADTRIKQLIHTLSRSALLVDHIK